MFQKRHLGKICFHEKLHWHICVQSATIHQLNKSLLLFLTFGLYLFQSWEQFASCLKLFKKKDRILVSFFNCSPFSVRKKGNNSTYDITKLQYSQVGLVKIIKQQKHQKNEQICETLNVEWLISNCWKIFRA